MKYLLTSLALSSTLLLSTQLQAQDSYWKGSSDVKNPYGECWRAGSFKSGDAACGAVAKAPAPVKVVSAPAPAKAAPAPTPAATEEPVIKEVINLKGVTFKTASNEILPSSYSRLNSSVEKLNSDTSLKVVVAGHTDNTGDTLNNLALSQKRAEAVRDYLIKQGVSANRLTARGYGDTEPTAANDTDEGRSQNRRVELRIH